MIKEMNMTRRIVTSNLQSGNLAAAGAAQPTVDNFLDKLWKYIPSEVNTFYVFVLGLIGGLAIETRPAAQWVVMVIGLVGAFFWTLRATNMPGAKPAYKQAGISTVAFLVWAFALGGPFAGFAWYNPVFGAILLAAFTMLIPLVDPN
jgi:hypothetical protein